jgi:hypothetical protein
VKRKSKIINDINAVQRFRKLLTVGYTIPPSAGVLVFVINYIINAARISSPIFPILFSILFFPPAIFTPYILYVLFKEKRFGWIAAYIIMVIIPGVIAITVLGYAYGLIILILFAPFYFFCFLIKFSVDEWIREYNWEQQLIEQRKEWEEKKNEDLL